MTRSKKETGSKSAFVLLQELSQGSASSSSSETTVDSVLEALHTKSVQDFLGVLHLTAVWSPAENNTVLTVMKINSATPKSEIDFFLLNAARAWADTVLTTGKIVREEPELRFGLEGTGALALAAWRNQIEPGRKPSPKLLILTSGRGLDLDHAVFDACRRSEQEVVFITSKTKQRSLEQLVAEAEIPDMSVEAFEAPNARSVVDWAKKNAGGRISIEAGPSTALDLYQPPVAVDRLWLSRYLGESLVEEARGGDFLSLSGGPQSLERLGTFNKPDEPLEAGDWAFSSWSPGSPGSPTGEN